MPRGEFENGDDADEEFTALICPLLSNDWDPGERCFKTSPCDAESGFDLSDPKWVEAIRREIEVHKHVFRKATEQEIERWRSAGNKLITRKLLLSVKRDGRYKARFVCLGFMDKVSGHDKYAAVPDLSVIKTLFALAATSNGEFSFFPSDATSAFLQSPYPAPVLIALDPRLHAYLGYDVGLVLYSTNGLRLSAVAWRDHRDKELRDLGWVQSLVDETLWKNRCILLVVFVDNFHFFGCPKIIQEEHTLIRAKLKLVPETAEESEEYTTWDVLSIRVMREKKTGDILLSQDEYVEKALARFGGQLGKVISTSHHVPSTQKILPF